jgi:predicted nucleic acid-binding protein
LAQERGYRIILDDHRARAVGRRLGLQVSGTIGILLKAKQENVIPAIRPLVAALEASGFYLSESLKEEVLQLAGE